MTDTRRRKIEALLAHGSTPGERAAAREALHRLDEPVLANASILPQTDEELLALLTDPSALRRKWHEALEKGRMWEYDLLYTAICKVAVERSVRRWREYF